MLEQCWKCGSRVLVHFKKIRVTDLGVGVGDLGGPVRPLAGTGDHRHHFTAVLAAQEGRLGAAWEGGAEKVSTSKELTCRSLRGEQER